MTTVFRAATIAVLATLAQGPPPDARQRAADLLREAREAIPSMEGSPPLASREHAQAGMFAFLATVELDAFPDHGVDDAVRAFALVKTLPGGGRDFEFTRTPTPEAMDRMAKQQIEFDMVRAIVSVNQLARARELAASADIEHADLYDPIVRAAPAGEILALAAECRASDGSYPYAAIADRVRALGSQDPLRRTLLDQTFAMVAGERTFKDRSRGLTFIERAYDLVAPKTAADALDALLGRMLAIPAANGDKTDLELFGPTILELMTRLDGSRAAAIAANHPDWDSERRIPGRTPFNPVGAPAGAVLRPAAPPSGVAPRPLGPTPPLPADLDRAISDARALPPGEKPERLVTIARALLGR